MLALLFAIVMGTAPIAAQDAPSEGAQTQDIQSQDTQPESAAVQSPTDTAPLIVATKHTPPFAFVGDDGDWSGIAIDAMTAIASDLGRSIEWREDTLDGMLAAVEAGEVDAAIAAITITPARARGKAGLHLSLLHHRPWNRDKPRRRKWLVSSGKEPLYLAVCGCDRHAFDGSTGSWRRRLGV